MPWGLYLLILSGIFAAIVSFYLYHDTGRYKFLGLLCASFFFIIIQIGVALQPVFPGYPGLFILKELIQWGSICCLALVLSSLLFFLREMTPDVLQIHLLYSAIPLLIILSFFLVYDSDLLKARLLMIYEASAALVAILLYGMSFYQTPRYRTAFTGILILCASFALYFALPLSYEYVARVALAAGVFTLFSGYLMINTYMHEGTVKKLSAEKSII
jgi:hypothetical protein